MTEVRTTLRSAYLAGPMRGYDEYNFPEFHKQTAWLRANGWQVFSPAERDENDPNLGGDYTLNGHGLDYFMAFDLKAVCEHDAVICLPGWERSQGARLETMTAVEIGHPVFEIVYRQISVDRQERGLEHVEPSRIAAEFIAGTKGYDGLATVTLQDHGSYSVRAEELEAHLARQTAVYEGLDTDRAVEVDLEQPDGESAEMRVFDSGATRNVEVDPDYHGFLSPLALHAYGEYMHRHRLQADGTMRDSDNWQKGIPNDAFIRSLVRHVHDIQLMLDGYGELARQDDRDDNPLLSHLAATLFNVQGLLHNVMLAIIEDEREGV